MARRVTPLPVVPLAQPVQLVLGLNGVGIVRPKRRRARRTPGPWLAARKAA